MTKRQRSVSNIEKELRPIAVVLACIPLLVCVMFTGCGLTDGHKHTGPVTVYMNTEPQPVMQACPKETTCFIGGGRWQDSTDKKAQFIRANGEIFVMLFSSPSPTFRDGQKLGDIEYLDGKDDTRVFIKAILGK